MKVFFAMPKLMSKARLDRLTKKLSKSLPLLADSKITRLARWNLSARWILAVEAVLGRQLTPHQTAHLEMAIRAFRVNILKGFPRRNTEEEAFRDLANYFEALPLGVLPCTPVLTAMAYPPTQRLAMFVDAHQRELQTLTRHGLADEETRTTLVNALRKVRHPTSPKSSRGRDISATESLRQLKAQVDSLYMAATGKRTTVTKDTDYKTKSQRLHDVIAKAAAEGLPPTPGFSKAPYTDIVRGVDSITRTSKKPRFPRGLKRELLP